MHNPMEKLMQWLEEENQQLGGGDPTAMALSTIGLDGYPRCRFVLLKGLNHVNGREGLTFYTNYQSHKGLEIAENPRASATWYWPETYRQIRVVGDVFRLSDEESDRYFAMRPKLSKASAIVSPQSEPIDSLKSLEEAMGELVASGGSLDRPAHWGGYVLLPQHIEFWQGKDYRLHYRELYRFSGREWENTVLAP